MPSRLAAPAALTLALSLGLGAALPAAAQQLFSRSPNEILQIARGYGPANFGAPDDAGRPIIDAETDDGILYGLLLYGCEGAPGCESVQFFASFETDEHSVGFTNQWNLDRRYATAYRAEDGIIYLAMSSNLDFGVTRENFVDTYEIWDSLLEEFTDRIYGAPDPGPSTPRPSK